MKTSRRFSANWYEEILYKKPKRDDNMITCSVCGCVNDSSRATCIECGSDLSDSEDWTGGFEDDLNSDYSEEMGYYDDSYYD